MTANSKLNNILIPNVSRLPEHKKADTSNRLDQSQNPDEFKKILNDQISGAKDDFGIHLSTHAARRLNERNLQIDSAEYLKLKNAISKLKEKGGQDSLVVTGKAAYIIDVPNNKIVTAIDKDQMAENVFTKIDSTMILN